MDDVLRISTLVLWVVALVLLCYSNTLYPAEHKKERFWYMMVLASYVIHVVVFYTVIFLIPPTAGVTSYGDWSRIIRIHGGFAIIFKELVAIARLRKFDNAK